MARADRHRESEWAFREQLRRVAVPAVRTLRDGGGLAMWSSPGAYSVGLLAGHGDLARAPSVSA